MAAGAPPQSAPVAGALLCLLSSGLLGVQIPLAKLAYQAGADPITFACIRALLAAPIFLIPLALRGKGFIPNGAAWRGVIVLALPIAMISFGYLGAVARIPASLAALIFYLHPLMVLLVDALRRREIPAPSLIFLFFLAFGGLAVVFGPAFHDLDPVGVGMAVAAAIGATSYFLAIPSAAALAPTPLLMGWSNLLVGLGFLIPVLMSGLHLPTGDAGWIHFSGAALTYAFGVGLTIPAIRRIGPVIGSMLFNFEPVVIVSLSAVLLDEVMTLPQYLGTAAVLAALVLAGQRKAR